MRAAQDTGVPITFGVLTTNTAEEALARAGEGPANKGREAAARGARARQALSAARRSAVTQVRHHARVAALQTLYLWEIGRTDPPAALDAYFAEHGAELNEEQRDFTRRLVLGAAQEVAELDRLIGDHSQHWRIDRLAVIDRLILRLGAGSSATNRDAAGGGDR